MNQPIKQSILAYEDNEALRKSLHELFRWDEAFELCAAKEDARNILDEIQRYQPALVLLDLDMPYLSGVEALQLLRPQYPSLPVVMLTVFEDNDSIVSAICAGANGYLLKKDIQQLPKALQEIQNGGAPLTSVIARKILEELTRRLRSENILLDQLTPRELETLELLAKGKSYKMIGDAMQISIETVRGNIKQIYRKLQVNSATEAVSLFHQNKH